MKPQEVWFRVVLLAVWAGAANLWSQRHFGFGLDDPVSLLGITGGPAVLFMILDRVLGSEEAKGLKGFFERWVRDLLRRSLLATPVLVLLYLGGIVLAATYSSVTVIPPRQGKELTVEVAPIGVAEAEARGEVSVGGPPARLRLVTSPFGRDLRLSVRGFVAQTITLYPLTGLTVDPDDDLRLLPTLLFRPTIDSLASLAQGGAIKAYKITDQGCTLLAEVTSLDGGRALMVGPQRAIPASYRANWNLELRAQGLDESTLARAMLAWNRPVARAGDQPPEPGDQIYVEVVTQAEKRKSEALMTVSLDAFQDIRLEKPLAATTACEQVR